MVRSVRIPNPSRALGPRLALGESLMRHLLVVSSLLACFVLACGSAETVTQKRMFDWAQALNVFLATNMEGGYVYPDRLEAVDGPIREHLELEDGWGRHFVYRKLTDEKYQILSGGPNGKVGDDDDVVLENGVLRKAEEVYAERPYSSAS
jgi:hypothetical protein